MRETAVVILNYNGINFLKQFLPAVVEHSSTASIIIADNASTDSSVAWAEKMFPQITLIRIPENRGYCGGYNYALKLVEAKYYVLLNSDVEVTTGWLDSLLRLISSDEKIAAVQPKILSFQNKKNFEYAGAAGGFIDFLGYPFCRGRIFQTIEEDTGQYDKSIPIFWASGACLVVRAKIFHSLGGFDEDFFAHMEEIDLCWRMARAGYEVWFEGTSRIYHVGGGTLPSSHPKKTYLNFRNGLSLLYKNLPNPQLWYKIPIRLILDWVAAFTFLLQGSGRSAFSVLRAHGSFIFHLGTENKKRKNLNYLPFMIKDNLIWKRSIVVAFFLKRKKNFRDLNQ